jgi:hypothetical protein
MLAIGVVLTIDVASPLRQTINVYVLSHWRLRKVLDVLEHGVYRANKQKTQRKHRVNITAANSRRYVSRGTAITLKVKGS